MRSFSKKLAFVLALALVLTGFAPAATAKAADDFSLNRTAQTLYVNEGVNDKGSETLADGLYGNVQKYDFNLKNKPADWKTAYSYKWASSDEKVATVNNSGLTTAVGVGKAVITCIVTEKATGSVAADLKATVQVKANAAKVEIYAADGNDYDGTTVAAGTIDFNRNMFDAAGNKTNKKGTYVTDLTRWVVAPADKGVTVNQANGVVTVAEDAKGEYTVYAETYQSAKYNQTTATSNKVTFTVGGDSFEVKQTTVKKFTVNFDAKVTALTTDDVVVNKLYKGFEIPALVKTVTLAKDGMSAEVEMFVNLAKDNEYVVNVAGFEALTFVAAGGDPVEVLIYVDEKEIGKEAELVYIDGNPVTLKYRLIDAKGVDVTDVAGGVVLFNAEKYSEDGSYYVSADQMWFAKEGVDIVVVADYQSGRYDNSGNQLAPAKGAKAFYSMKKEPVQFAGFADFKIAGSKDDWSDAKKEVPFGEAAELVVKVKLTEGNPVVAKAGDAVLNGYIKYEELTPAKAVLSGSNVVFFTPGEASFLVYYCYTENNAFVELPIAKVTVKATAARGLQTMTLDKSSTLTLGTENGYDEATITVSAKDNYGADYDVTGKVTVEGVDNNAKVAFVENVSYKVEGNKVTIYGYELKQNTPNTPDTVQLTFKIKVDGKLEQNVTVLLKSKGATGTEYIQLEAAGFGVDVARTAASAAAKTGSFTVYKYSNGIKVGTQELNAYDANAITANAYYFKVTKDGKDITAKVDATAATAGKVTVNFSTVKADGTVDYTDLGAGNYVFTLYKGVAVGDKAIAVQQNASAGSVTCNVGAYGAAVRAKDSLGGDTSDAAIRAAFNIKNTKGEESTSTYTVKTVGADDANMKYVYVESFTFYDDLGDGAKAVYTVPVGVALMK